MGHGVGEEYVEGGGFGSFGMGFGIFGAEEEQGPDQIRDRSLEGCQLAATDFGAERNQLADTQIHAWEWGGDQMELEIPQEEVHGPTGAASSSAMLSSTSTSDGVSPSTDCSPVQCNEKPSSGAARSGVTSADGEPAEAWTCDVTDCDRAFTHRHKLKYVVHYITYIVRPRANTIKSPQEVSCQTLSLP